MEPAVCGMVTMTEAAAICDFLVRLSADLEGGGVLPLSFYLARFPDHEAAIAREYLSHAALTVPPAVVEGASEPDGRSTNGFARYEVHDVVGRGGTGTVLRVRDTTLDRELAMKVHHRLDESSRRRFLAEARVTCLLDHPGVVPVHDIGRTGDDRPFFTMRLIRGITLKDAIVRHHERGGDWTLARALDVMARVCDAMAYAHSLGVVHRDLKPANVMLGEFGEVYVVDWGLARASGCGSPPVEANEPERATLTIDGDVFGTPSYMAPEQAEGVIAELGPSADVYSVGAILYHLLTGHPPYAAAGESATSREILSRVRRGSLPPLLDVRPRLAPELVAICERAMHRRREDRYPDMRAMAADVRAFLEQRVVSAHEVGAAARVRKWIVRNRAMSTTIAAALVGSLLAAVAVIHESHARSRALGLLTDAVTPETIERRFEMLWPIDERRVPAVKDLIAEAREIVSRRDADARELELLRARALPLDPTAPSEERFLRNEAERMVMLAALADRIERTLLAAERGEARLPDRESAAVLLARMQALRIEIAQGPRLDVPHLTFRFRDAGDQVLFDALSRLPRTIDGLIETAPVPGFLPVATRSIDLALMAARRVPEDIERRWAVAIDEIADPERAPRYGGLRLVRQDGLVPIGPDPDCGLWEFAHVLSGDVPERDGLGRLRLTPEHGVVMVLIPGGEARIGSQRSSVDGYRIDPWADYPSHVISPFPIHPYLLAKYEVTQAQWERLTTRNPSHFVGRAPRADQEEDASITPMHPVESVSWYEAERALRRVGLVLPTEMQWEHAYRAGTETIWPTGDEPETIVGFGNVADVSGIDVEAIHERMLCSPNLDDGHARYARVDAFLPNGFGLVGMIGNVGEWCRDRGPVSYDRAVLDFHTGERRGDGDGTRVVRGGSFLRSVIAARSSSRLHLGPGFRDRDVGMRAAMDVHP